MQDVHAADGADRGDRLPHRLLGEPDQGRCVVDVDGLAQCGAQPVGVTRRGDPQAGHDLEDGHVPHAVVGGPVGPGDPGPVEHERDAAPVQGDIHQ